MITYQDLLEAKNNSEKSLASWIGAKIEDYRQSEAYLIALDADEYDAQRNTGIRNFQKLIYDITGVATPDTISANSRIPSNFFHRLNVDRCAFSLGNGITFANTGSNTAQGNVKEALGDDFDHAVYSTAYYALIHGRCYLFCNGEKFHVFPMTEFMPLEDEETGAIRAGIRFWSLDWSNRPVVAVLYEEDGYTVYQTEKGKYGTSALAEKEPKRAYILHTVTSEADGETIIGGENYGVLPIIPLYGNRVRQSTLVGMKENIDAYDLIHSGFVNDLRDCAQVYWLIGNAMGMTNDDRRRFLESILFQRVVNVDDSGATVTPYTTNIPHEAREVCLKQIKEQIYLDFGNVDIRTLSEHAKTGQEIEAAYSTMNREADDFEYQVIVFIQQILKVRGLPNAVPVFKRDKIYNQKEQTDMIMEAAEHLDEVTILRQLPFITADEVGEILRNRVAQAMAEKETMEQLEKELESAVDDETA